PWPPPAGGDPRCVRGLRPAAQRLHGRRRAAGPVQGADRPGHRGDQGVRRLRRRPRPRRGPARGDRGGGRRDDGGGHPHERRPGHGLGAARLRGLPGVRRRGQPTRVLTAAVSSLRAFLASAKYMLVLGSTYSSLSMPAEPDAIDRLITMMLLAWSTSRIGMPEIAVPGRRAAGLVTSLAPTTSATSARGNSGLISSISLSCG